MNPGQAIRGITVGLLGLLLAACSDSSDGGGLLGSNPANQKPTLTITGPDSVVSGSSQDYVVTALDRAGEPVKGVTVTLASTLGTLSQPEAGATTDVSGELVFSLAATTTSNSGTVTPVTGTATLTAKGQVDGSAVSDTRAIEMTPTVFQFTSPNAGARIPLNTLHPLVLQWTSNRIAVADQVTFTAKVGTLVDASGNAGSTLTVPTDGSGYARLQFLSSTSGVETLTAKDVRTGNFEAELTVTYIGEPATFTASAPASIPASNGAGTVSVKVLDSAGSPVPGVSVSFTLAAGTPSAGTLSPATAVTNASGIATSVYRANGGAGTAKINIQVETLPVQSVSIAVAS